MRRKITVPFVVLFSIFISYSVCFCEYLDYYSHKSVCPSGGNMGNGDYYNSALGAWVNGATGFAQCNCTDYAAEEIGITNGYLGVAWSHGKTWNDAAENIGITVDRVPLPGDIAYWDDLSVYGHVAYVEKVNFSNGVPATIDITEYNYPGGNAFNQRTISISNPDGFIHIIAYEEGVTSLHYLDCYEMECPGQTQQEWNWIANKVWNDYRCTNCSAESSYDVAYVNAIATGFGGGVEENNPTPSDPLPNLHIEEFNVHDTPDHKLPDDGTGYLNPGQTYELHVWPEALEEHCGNGTDDWEQEVRTDTFAKISLSEDDGEWELIHRSYTHCKYMDEDDSKKEIFDWTVPEDAAGKLIAFKSKVDTQNIIQETDEKDNWSDTEYYPVEGYCPNCPDLAVPYIGLTAGKTSVDLGGKFGLEVDVMNQGNVNCPIDIRGAYYLKAPNATSWTQVADDGSEASDLSIGESEREYTMDSPFTANQVGTWQAMFCADHLNAVREQDENNNCRIFNFNVNPVGPDLIISSLGFKEGLSFKRKISSHPWANVRNIGNRTPSFDIRIAYYIDGQYRDDDGVSADELTPGRDQYESVNNDNIKLGDWGTRTLTVCVDVNGQVPELNESNNCASVKFTVIR